MDDVTELAWAAGFFEGEGCVNLVKRFKCVQLTVSQSSDVSDEPPPELVRFQAAIGGRGSISKRPPSWRLVNGVRITTSKKQRWLWRLQNATSTAEVLAELGEHFSDRGKRRFVDRAQRYLAARQRYLAARSR